jgi:hypothetical protein
MAQALSQRAFSAYLQREGLDADQPTSASSVEKIGDLKYVVDRLKEQARKAAADGVVTLGP